MPSNPFLDPDFHIRWSALKPDQIAPAIESALATAQADIDRIAAEPETAGAFEDTFLALEHATEALNVAWGKVAHLQSVADEPALRDAYNRMLPKVAAFQAAVPLNAGLWRRLQNFALSPAAAAVTGVHRRFMEETMKDFRQAGADLPTEKRARLETLQGELAQSTQKYSENVLDATNAWQVVVEDEARLAGLPDHAKAAARRSAEAKGLPGWRFTLQATSFEPLITYGVDEALRRELWTASVAVGSRAPHDNTPLISRILALRAEKASLLGYPHFADLQIERRMAKSGARAMAFIVDLQRRAAPAFHEETRTLEHFKAAQTG